jgi:hypothetical protein
MAGTAIHRAGIMLRGSRSASARVISSPVISRLVSVNPISRGAGPVSSSTTARRAPRMTVAATDSTSSNSIRCPSTLT